MSEEQEKVALTVEGEGVDAVVKCPSCGSQDICFANDQTEYGYVRGVRDGALSIKITELDSQGSRLWCADCETAISLAEWDYDYF